MLGRKALSDIKGYNIQDYEYISNDPDENADNFDPKWALLREMSTDKERFQAIRKRWGNVNIPNPQINLTCRQMKDQPKSEPNGNSTNPSESNSASHPGPSATRSRIMPSRRRSRSCTRPYEQLILNLEKNYQAEYFQLMYRHKAELQDMLQFQLMQLQAFNDNYNFGRELGQNLHFQQEQQVIDLLSNQYKEVQYFLGEKNEGIDACKKYLEEVKAFFTFYQNINDDRVTLQMTDEQYEHTAETERMYSLYSKFYN